MKKLALIFGCLTAIVMISFTTPTQEVKTDKHATIEKDAANGRVSRDKTYGGW